MSRADIVRRDILQTIAQHGHLGPTAIVSLSGWSRETVYRVLRYLEASGQYVRPPCVRRPPPPPLTPAQAQLSAAELAERLGVSERTARRYLARARRSASPTAAAPTTP